MKKMLLSLAISTALVGCGGGETLQDVKQESTPVLPSASIKFDPSNGVVSIPNDLLFSGTRDGTLNLPGELDGEGKPLLSAADYANPSNTLGALDGWSTQMPYVIDLDIPADMAINAESVSMPDSVKLFELVMGASQSDDDCKAEEPGLACKLVGELTFGVDFVAKLTDTKDGILIVPLKPFKPGSTYLTVLTDNIVMQDGRPVKPSSTYTLAKQQADLVTPSQVGLQKTIRSYEAVIASEVASERIIYSSAATIQSVGPVMNAIKQSLALSIKQGTNPAIELSPLPAMSVADVLGQFVADPATVAPFQAVEYMQGKITLPMYAEEPEGGEISDLAGTYWKAMCDSAVSVIGAKANKVDLTKLPAGPNDAFCDAVSGGALRDLGLDSQRFLTKYNFIPQKQWDAKDVTVQITRPNAALLGIEQPATGWPVVILQHGITASKESMLGLTLALSSQGFATIAIDHPMHGDRGVKFGGDKEGEFNATDGKGSVLSYMNLTSMLVARDNLRQSAADLLALRLGLNFIDRSLGLNTLDVSFVGHSLGSIVAPNFVTHANTPLSEAVDPLFKVQALGLASGGSGIANFLIESQEFGNFVKGSVVMGANNTITKAFTSFMASDATADCPAAVKLPCSYGLYEASLKEQGDAAALQSIASLVSQFVTVAQTSLDSADPTSYTSSVQALGTPVYMSVVVGGVDANGVENAEDTVIPPTTALPLSGSLPMAAMMGLTPVSDTQNTLGTGEPKSYLVNFTQGSHASIVTSAQRPSSKGTAAGHQMATVEMQKQLVSFLKSKGLYLAISNPDVVAKQQ